eukprot:7330904-Prymnesium_polylepis.1
MGWTAVCGWAASAAGGRLTATDGWAPTSTAAWTAVCGRAARAAGGKLSSMSGWASASTAGWWSSM